MTAAKPGRWKKGESGNPAGRRRGTDTVARIRASIANRVPDILAKLIEQALDGDVAASRLLLERAIPPLKASEQAVALHLAKGTLTDKGRSILDSVAAGELAPTQGSQLITALGALAQITRADELTKRIEQMEATRDNT